MNVWWLGLRAGHVVAVPAMVSPAQAIRPRTAYARCAWRSRSRASSNCPRSRSTAARFDCLMAMEGCPGANVFSSEASAFCSRSPASSNRPRSSSTSARFDCLRAMEGCPGASVFSAEASAFCSRSRLLQLPQIPQHHRQIRLTPGDGGVSGHELLMRGAPCAADRALPPTAPDPSAPAPDSIA